MKAYRKKQLVGRICVSNPPIRTESLAVCLSKTALHLAILALLYPALSYANPDGAQVVNGQVTIDTATPGVTTVTNSPNAIINWQNFSIGQNELTQFIQQNGQSAVLNRIIGQNPSEILGQLTSNGKVFLINPNGIVFGANSVIDTQGLIASSLNLSDQDFLSGNYHFTAGSTAGNIVNEGIIRAGKDGNIILIAPQIQNNGIIQSDGGSITLAAGREMTITNLDNPDIRFQIQAPSDSVLNLGKLLSEGGAINVFASTITHSGEINADSVQVDKQGHIQLVAQQDISLTAGSKISANNSQGDAGTIHIDSQTGTLLAQGTIEAKATQVGKGGKIELLGERVGVLDQAKIDASGENGGGEVLIGGDYQGKNSSVHNAKATYIDHGATINADAKTTGNGGKVIVWSDNSTRAYGDISAQGGNQSGNGGFIETSGHWLDTAGIRINASALNGIGGNWLLDPYDLTITAVNPGYATYTAGSPAMFTSGVSGTTVFNGDIQTQLNNGTSVTLQTGSGSGGLGDITVNASISKTSGGDATLQLWADNNIIINNSISSSFNKLNLVFKANNNGTGSQGNIEINSNAAINTNGGYLQLKATGTISTYADLTTNNQKIELASKILNINSLINAGTQAVNLTMDTLNWDSAGKGRVIGGEVGINTYSTGRPITVGGGCIGGSGTCLSVTQLWKVTAPVIGIGSDNSSGSLTSGDIYVAGITYGSSLLSDRNAATTRIGLLSGGTITQSATPINVYDLGIKANGAVTLTTANNITNLAAKTLGSDLNFVNGQGLSVIQMSGGTGYDPISKNYDYYDINGINTCLTSGSCGSVNLTASNNGTLTINAPITAGGITLTGGTLAGTYADLYWQYFNGGTGGSTTQKYTQTTIAGVLGTTQSWNPLADDSNGGFATPTDKKDKKTNKQCTK